MGFLVHIWRVIMTAMVVVPKVWPLIKQFFGFVLDYWAKRRLAQKKDEELKQAVKESEEGKDTSKLEQIMHLGSEELVGTAKAVATHEATPVAQASSSDPSIEEKKSPPITLDTAGTETSSSSTIVGTVFKIAAAGLGLAALSALLSNKESKAASMSFSSNASSIINDTSGTIKNVVYFKGGSKLTSRLIPVFLLFLILNACSHVLERNEPNLNPRLYAGDSKTKSIIRTRGESIIRCDQPAFDHFVCLPYEDIIQLQKAIDACERFGSIE